MIMSWWPLKNKQCPVHMSMSCLACLEFDFPSELLRQFYMNNFNFE